MLLVSIVVSSCSNDAPIDKEQYIEQVYLNGGGTEGNIYTQDICPASIDTTYFTICIGGSKLPSKDANILLAENDTSISIYNYKYRFDDTYKYMKMPSSTYSYNNNVTLNEGNAYVRVPIIINATKLNPDSLYMIPIKIAKSNFKISENSDSVMLFSVDFVNNYSGTYNTVATYSGGKNGTYSSSRTLSAIDPTTVRFIMYDASDETLNYAANHGVNMKIDTLTNNVSVTPFNMCDICNGSGKYYPASKKYVVNFVYTDSTGKVMTYNITFTKADSSSD